MRADFRPSGSISPIRYHTRRRSSPVCRLITMVRWRINDSRTRIARDSRQRHQRTLLIAQNTFERIFGGGWFEQVVTSRTVVGRSTSKPRQSVTRRSAWHFARHWPFKRRLEFGIANSGVNRRGAASWSLGIRFINRRPLRAGYPWRDRSTMRLCVVTSCMLLFDPLFYAIFLSASPFQTTGGQTIRGAGLPPSPDSCCAGS